MDGALLIPLDDMRLRVAEVARDRPVYVYCRSGFRAYLAVRILASDASLLRGIDDAPPPGRLPTEYRGTTGTISRARTLPQLKQFVEDGGTLVAIGDAALVGSALDLPIRDNTQRLIDDLNDFVVGAGGRVYLAKDAFTRPAHFHAMEPRLAAFDAVRRRWDPDRVIRSAQSIRLFGDRP